MASFSSFRSIVPVGALVAALSGCEKPPQAAVASPLVAPSPAPPPVASAEPIATAAPTESAASAAEPEPPADSAPLAPLPPPDAPPPQTTPAAPRLLLVDELPYYPVHLHAHDSSPEPHHPSHHPNRTGDEHNVASNRRPYHPAPGIVVDVVDAQGGLQAADVQRLARNAGYWPFRQCYEEGLRKNQRLTGKVALELLINPKGTPDQSTVAASTLSDEIVAACVAREARHLAFTSSEAQTDAKINVLLALGDEPVPSAKPLPNAAIIRDALHGSWETVRRCYLAGLARHPDAGGRMEIMFHVRHNGEIAELSEADSRFGDADVTRCVLGVYRATKLAAAAHGHELHFVYALHFESKAGDPFVAP